MWLQTPAQRRRRKAIERRFPEAWGELLDAGMAHWRWLDDGERADLEALVKVFLEEKRFEWVSGLDGDDSIRVLVAAQACLLLLGLDHDYYRGVTSIIVYPTAMVRSGTFSSPAMSGLVTDGSVPLLGETRLHGPVVIAWDSARQAARHPERGHNVVYHEFAHKIDMLDGYADGSPPMRREDHARWTEVCDREFQLLVEGNGDEFLDSYGSVNRGEFFAVATEYFFDLPVAMRERKPDLYEVLSAFYRQDPAARMHRD